MLTIGCVSGAVQVNLRPLSAIIGTVLPLTIYFGREDSHCTVINESGISSLDFALILPQLKLSTLNVISALLLYPFCTLSKIASEIIVPVSNLIAMQSTSKMVLEASLVCVLCLYLSFMYCLQYLQCYFATIISYSY